MREILFRGKTEKGEWVYGNLLHPDNYGNGYSIEDFTKDKNNCFDIIPETVGQYTGLTDKNGKKIFEGDVCKNTRTGEIVSVKWHGTMAGYVWSKRKENNQYLFDFGELFRVYDKYEVIGNIHDNPELIGGGEDA